ncbi:hypothetical protein B0H19DRAFT_1080583 [Mycena capillaripes]|nr:hypothetical protein B0H19DRAFT_1080583 [Mycena capillaripes]
MEDWDAIAMAFDWLLHFRAATSQIFTSRTCGGSDYYYKYDQSLFYIWASLPDPRFNYKKLRKEYAHDPELSKYLEEQKTSFWTYFDKHYPAATTSKPSAATATTVDGAGSSRPKVINFAVFDQGSDNEDETPISMLLVSALTPTHSTGGLPDRNIRKVPYNAPYRTLRPSDSLYGYGCSGWP